MIEWDAAQVAAAAGAQVVSTGGPSTPGGVEAGGPRRVSIDSRERAAGRPVRGPAGRAGGRRGLCGAGIERGRVGCAGAPAHAESLEAGLAAALAGPADAPGGSGPGAVLAHPDPLAGAAVARPRVATGAGGGGREGGRGHRLDWQDLDEGHPRGAAARRGGAAWRPDGGEPGEPEHRDRAAAGGARRAAGHEGAGAGDGDAGAGADRAADGDRRAGGGRDRERRPRAPSSSWGRWRRSPPRRRS